MMVGLFHIENIGWVIEFCFSRVNPPLHKQLHVPPRFLKVTCFGNKLDHFIVNQPGAMLSNAGCAF